MMLAALLALPLALMPQSKAADPQGKQRSGSATSSAGAVDGALVHIETPEGTGSGFQYFSQGYVITNRHVLDDIPTGGKVTLRPVKEDRTGVVGLGDPFEGTVRFKHPRLDVAVIEIPKSRVVRALKPIATPDNKHVPRGTTLIAHGFPAIGRNATPTISQGLLSAHYTDPRSGQVFYFTDVALSPGSSGGPVTDSSGAVIGVATAVSIVTDGAGNSWGYVLPIRVIEEAISCTKGFAALPKPFDPSRHVRAIASATSADSVMSAYEKGVAEAVKQTGSAIELNECMDRLLKAVAATKVPLPRERYKSFNDSANRAAVALNTHLLELWILDEDSEAESIMGRLYRDQSMGNWIIQVIQQSFEGLSAEDRAISFGDLMSTHANGVVQLIASASPTCDSALEAAAALEGQGASRSKVQSLSKALSTLLVCYANVLQVDPQSIDTNNQELPLKVRQRLREATTALQNAIDEWSQLPEECRQPIEEMLHSLTGLESDAPNDPAQGAAPGTGDGLGPPNTKLGASLAWWTERGFEVWGEVQTDTAEGKEHGYTITFKEEPSMAWFGVRSDRAKRFELSVTGPGGDEVEQTGSVTDNDITWHCVELTDHGKYRITFTTDDAADYPFEFVGVTRSSPFVENRILVRESKDLKGFKELETRSIYVDAGGRYEVTFDASKQGAFLVVCDDVDGNDIDIEVVDPDGDVVSKDDRDKPFATAVIRSPMRGEYTIRVLNASREPVMVDLMFFATPKD